MTEAVNGYDQKGQPQEELPEVGVGCGYEDGGGAVGAADDADGAGFGDVEGNAPEDIGDEPGGDAAQEVKAADDGQKKAGYAEKGLLFHGCVPFLFWKSIAGLGWVVKDGVA